MSIFQAIDDLLAFVGDRRKIPRSEIQRFRELDKNVYVLACRLNLQSCLPPIEELERPLHAPEMRKVQFAGRTNLPGDWDSDEFFVQPNLGWKDSLDVLRELAAKQGEAATSTSVLSNHPEPTRKRSANPVEAVLDEDGKKILTLARSDRSADERMRLIRAVNESYALWTSPKWADLLGVSEGAIRKTDFWKIDRKEAIEENRRDRK